MVATSVAVLPAASGTETGTVAAAAVVDVAAESPRLYSVVPVLAVGSVCAPHDTEVTNTSTSAASVMQILTSSAIKDASIAIPAATEGKWSTWLRQWLSQ